MSRAMYIIQKQNQSLKISKSLSTTVFKILLVKVTILKLNSDENYPEHLIIRSDLLAQTHNTISHIYCLSLQAHTVASPTMTKSKVWG